MNIIDRLIDFIKRLFGIEETNTRITDLGGNLTLVEIEKEFGLPVVEDIPPMPKVKEPKQAKKVTKKKASKKKSSKKKASKKKSSKKKSSKKKKED